MGKVKTDTEFKQKIEDSVSNFGDVLSDQLKTLHEEVSFRNVDAYFQLFLTALLINDYFLFLN